MAAKPPTEPNGAKKRHVALVLAILLMIGGVVGYNLYLKYRHYESTDDAFIDSNIVQVAPQVRGQIIKLHVTDNQPVKAGDLIAEINPNTYQVQLDLRRAALALAESQLNSAKINVDLVRATTDAKLAEAEANLNAARARTDQSHAQQTAAEAQARQADEDRKRADKLGLVVISPQERERADTAYRTASASLDEARKAVTSAEAQYGAATAQLQEAKTGAQQVAMAEAKAKEAADQVTQAKAAVSAAEIDLADTKIFAPVDGQVTRRGVDTGDYVQVGQALLALVPTEVWVTANFKETQLTDMGIGQPVVITVDAYPGRKFTGKVNSIQAGTGARFSLLPPENATGNFVKVVQRVPVKIVLDKQPDGDPMLAPGMSVIAKVRVR